MKKSILILTAIVALASCGNETKETKSDSTIVVDSTMVDSLSTDSTVMVDSMSVEK
jgi:hypothetical protein